MGEKFRIDYAEKTDVGRKRDHNEDSLTYVVPTSEEDFERMGALFIVADGMGGHEAGEVASKIAIDTIREHYYELAKSNPVQTALMQALHDANSAIKNYSSPNASQRGMGTTCVAAVLRDGYAYLANVGDSRGYLVRGERIRQVTNDHSWVAEQVRAGMITEDQARHHIHKNVITRCLGTQDEVEVDLFTVPLLEHDQLLLCSDGLSGLVTDSTIAGVISASDPDQSVEQLIDLANNNGGPDNISAMVVRVLEIPHTAETPTSPPDSLFTETRRDSQERTQPFVIPTFSAAEDYNPEEGLMGEDLTRMGTRFAYPPAADYNPNESLSAASTGRIMTSSGAREPGEATTTRPDVTQPLGITSPASASTSNSSSIQTPPNLQATPPGKFAPKRKRSLFVPFIVGLLLLVLVIIGAFLAYQVFSTPKTTPTPPKEATVLPLPSQPTSNKTLNTPGSEPKINPFPAKPVIVFANPATQLVTFTTPIDGNQGLALVDGKLVAFSISGSGGTSSPVTVHPLNNLNKPLPLSLSFAAVAIGEVSDTESTLFLLTADKKHVLIQKLATLQTVKQLQPAVVTLPDTFGSPLKLLAVKNSFFLVSNGAMFRFDAPDYKQPILSLKLESVPPEPIAFGIQVGEPASAKEPKVVLYNNGTFKRFIGDQQEPERQLPPPLDKPSHTLVLAIGQNPADPSGIIYIGDSATGQIIALDPVNRKVIGQVTRTGLTALAVQLDNGASKETALLVSSGKELYRIALPLPSNNSTSNPPSQG